MKKLSAPLTCAILMAFVLRPLSTIARIPVGIKPAELPSESQAAIIKCRIGGDWVEVKLVGTGFAFSNEEGAQAVLEEVLRAAGYLPTILIARAARVSNVLVCPSEGVDYILYNPGWFKGVYVDAEEIWADRAVFAHEVGHYEHNDFRKALSTNREIELAADEFAGKILARMGATLEQARFTFNSKQVKRGSHGNHGTPAERLAAVEKGWRESNSTLRHEKVRIDSRTLFDSGLLSYRNEDYEKAEKEFSKAIRIDSNFARAYLYRGIVLDKQGQTDRAVLDFQKVIEIDPNSFPATINLGSIYFRRKMYEPALTLFDRAVAIDPKNPLAFRNRCGANIYSRKFDNAIRDCTEAIRLLPEYAEAYSNRGVAFYNRGKAFLGDKTPDYERAIADLTRAISIDPFKASYFRNRAMVFKALGKADLALRDEQNAEKLK